MEPEHAELNLTPYLDVLMNLIVFMLIAGSGLVGFGAIPVNAQSETGRRGDGAPHTLQVTRAGLSLDGSDVTPAALRAQLAALAPGSRALLVGASADVTLERLVEVLDLAREEHFDEITLRD